MDKRKRHILELMECILEQMDEDALYIMLMNNQFNKEAHIVVLAMAIITYDRNEMSFV